MGAILAGIAGQCLKPTLMELGGKAPVLVLRDAELELAASDSKLSTRTRVDSAVTFGAFMNAGQICMSTERIIVARSMYDKLEHALKDAWSKQVNKTPRALFSTVSHSRVQAIVDDALSHGARDVLNMLPGDSTMGDHGLLRPAILAPITPDMRIYREETFAPLAGIVVVEDSGMTEDQLEDQMVSIANDTDFGLTASIWSKNVERARTLAERLECGAVHVNGPVSSSL